MQKTRSFSPFYISFLFSFHEISDVPRSVLDLFQKAIKRYRDIGLAVTNPRVVNFAKFESKERCCNRSVREACTRTSTSVLVPHVARPEGFPWGDARSSPIRKIQNRAGVKQEDSARRRRRRRWRKRRRKRRRLRRRRRRRVDRATTSSSRPLDGAADDLTLTDSRLLLVASALFISPILPWTLRSSILARTLQHRPALLPFVREIVAERVRRAMTLVRPVANHLKCCRAGDSHRDPPHHPRVQHETSLALAPLRHRSPSRNRNSRSGVDGDHQPTAPTTI